MNPILSRELRSRFRDKRAFWLLFAITVLLCGAAYFIYMRAFNLAEDWATSGQPNYAAMNYGYSNGYSSAYSGYGGYPYSTQLYFPSIQERASLIGRQLFEYLARGNVLFWLLIGPSLTATGLCREREKGLLESLWLSPFKVSHQIIGRFLAAILFVFEIQLVTLPVYGIAVMLGGVSPHEIGMVAGIVAMTAFTGAALGLWCSARAYRPTGGMAAALQIVVIGSFLGYYLLVGLLAIASSNGWYQASMAIQVLMQWHPYLLLESAVLDSSSIGFSRLISMEDFYWLALFSYLGMALLFLVGATRMSSKPLPEAAWLGRNPLFDRWRRRIEENKKARLERQEAAKVGEKVSGALLYELPLEKLVRFRDPLLRREVRARFRLRQRGLGIAVLRFVALFVVVLTWLAMISTLFDPPSRRDAGQVLAIGLWGLGVAVVGFLASTAFTAERESGTWEGLKLSLLTVREVIASKWLSPLVTFAYWSSPLWIWLPVCVNVGKYGGIPVFNLLCAVSTAIFSLAAAAAWGLYISTRAPHSAAATGWTLATLLILLIGTPVLVDVFNLKPTITGLVFGSDTMYYDASNGTDPYSGAPYGVQNAYESDFKSRSYAARQFQIYLDAYNPYSTLEWQLDRGNRSPNYSGYDPDPIPYDDGTKFGMWCVNAVVMTTITGILLIFATKRVNKLET